MSFAGLPFRIVQLGAVASTQQELRFRLEAGERVHGLVLRAREQSAGRGRRGRSFVAAAGGSYQSLAVRCDALPSGSEIGVTGIALAVGLAEGFAQYGVRLALKWPNDLFYRDKKLGGILVERVRDHLLIGVGVNVDNPVPAGAVALRGWDLDGVHLAVLDGVDRGLALLAAGEALLGERFAPFDLLRGRGVVVESGGERIRGRSEGVDGRGRLLLRGTAGLTAVARGSVVGFEQRSDA